MGETMVIVLAIISTVTLLLLLAVAVYSRRRYDRYGARLDELRESVNTQVSGLQSQTRQYAQRANTQLAQNLEQTCDSMTRTLAKSTQQQQRTANQFMERALKTQQSQSQQYEARLASMAEGLARVNEGLIQSDAQTEHRMEQLSLRIAQEVSAKIGGQLAGTFGVISTRIADIERTVAELQAINQKLLESASIAAEYELLPSKVGVAIQAALVDVKSELQVLSVRTDAAQSAATGSNAELCDTMADMKAALQATHADAYTAKLSTAKTNAELRDLLSSVNLKLDELHERAKVTSSGALESGAVLNDALTRLQSELQCLREQVDRQLELARACVIQSPNVPAAALPDDLARELSASESEPEQAPPLYQPPADDEQADAVYPGPTVSLDEIDIWKV